MNARVLSSVIPSAVQPPQVICLGEALLDRLGPPGGDPATAPADQLDDRLGGAPANVACALAQLGTPVAFLGRLGRDAIGAAFAELFARRGVEVSGLQWDGERPSRVVLVRRDASGERHFQGFAGGRDGGAGGGVADAVFADQALAAEALTEPLQRLMPQAAWLLVGTIPLASPPAAGALQLALERAAAAGVALAVDVNWRPTFWDGCAAATAGPSAVATARIRPLLERAALLKLAAEEATWLFASRDPAAIRAALPQRPAVVVTDGSAPVAWCFGDQAGALPAFAVPVVDSTGAGDAFLAGLLHRLCLEPDLLRAAADDGPRLQAAIRFASACGALVCQGSGAIDPQPIEQTVTDFLAGQSNESATPPKSMIGP
ncbi:carbohydrate kinase family protein [Vulcanococcus limneticus]|uniref:carbohydrate kinase family protein n=1 Tax=Vulcanococcus limneticus TaxID=2170428 RepID=UPI00398C1AF7